MAGIPLWPSAVFRLVRSDFHSESTERSATPTTEAEFNGTMAIDYGMIRKHRPRPPKRSESNEIKRNRMKSQQHTTTAAEE